MAQRGSKAKYSAKQKRQAEHIEEGYQKRGVPSEVAEERAWATVNKIYGGAAHGSGHSHPVNREPMHRGGYRGGKRLGMSHGRTGHAHAVH